MTGFYYADIAAVRIQSWLARTPKLKGRRGGSILLQQLTSHHAVEPLLPERVDINPETGDIDGVVSLRSVDAALLDATTVDVLQRLRRELPALELQAAVTEAPAPDYFSAYPALQSILRRGEGHYWQPVTADLPFAAPCASCGIDPGVELRDISPEPADKKQRLCHDCAVRFDAAGRTTDDRRTPDVTGRLATWLGQATDTLDWLEFPDDFKDLAQFFSTTDTHVATIYIDGNRIGDLFEAAAAAGADRARLSAGIYDATRIALVEAIPRAFHRFDQQSVPVIPHLIGGDDMLISVPAALGWQVTIGILNALSRALNACVAELGLDTSQGSPSASAGLVVHHHSHPFSLTVASAGEALSKAKSSAHGAAAVAWLDVTSGGDEILGPVTTKWYAANESTLASLAEQPQSQRAQLSVLADHQLPRQVERMDIAPAKALLGQSAEALREGLSIVKWWAR